MGGGGGGKHAEGHNGRHNERKKVWCINQGDLNEANSPMPWINFRPIFKSPAFKLCYAVNYLLKETRPLIKEKRDNNICLINISFSCFFFLKITYFVQWLSSLVSGSLCWARVVLAQYFLSLLHAHFF